jgi:hypothetical protein
MGSFPFMRKLRNDKLLKEKGSDQIDSEKDR